MPIDSRWDRLSPVDWDRFAQAWIVDLRKRRGNGDTPECVDEEPTNEVSNIAQSVVMMNFTARAAHQWQFILCAMKYASDDELGDVAAGPFEHLLGNHGDQYIEPVETLAATDPRFAAMIAKAWQYMMSDEVWARIQAIQARVRSQPES